MRFALMRRFPRSELKNLYKLVSLNRFRSSSVKVPFVTNSSSSFVKEACVYLVRGNHCIASCIKVPHWAPVNTSSSDCNACGLRPNTELAKSSAETVTVCTPTLASPFAIWLALLLFAALDFFSSSLIAWPKIAAETARWPPVSTVAIGSLRYS